MRPRHEAVASHVADRVRRKRVGGVSSVTSLTPFYIKLGAVSTSGAWKITTGAGVSCIAFGNFT